MIKRTTFLVFVLIFVCIIFLVNHVFNHANLPINEILINRNTPKLRFPGPTTSDVLGIIPLKNIQRLRERGEPYIEFGGSLQTNKRIYFGPVNIERLRVRLVDDKGNLVNLHDNDWSFTLQVEQLYQY